MGDGKRLAVNSVINVRVVRNLKVIKAKVYVSKYLKNNLLGK